MSQKYFGSPTETNKLPTSGLWCLLALKGTFQRPHVVLATTETVLQARADACLLTWTRSNGSTPKLTWLIHDMSDIVWHYRIMQIVQIFVNILCTRYPTKSKRQPFTLKGCYLFSSELKAASCSIAGLETQGELDNDGQRPSYPMDASAKANRSNCHRLVYKSHLELAICVLLFDRIEGFKIMWSPMIAFKLITNLSAILCPPNPQFATSESECCHSND